MTTKRLSAAEQSVDRHYALHMSHENDADWICPACGPSEKTLSAMEFWKSSMRWSDRMDVKEACEFAEAYASTQPRWIAVSERLPEDKQMVHGWHENGMTNPIIVRYIGGRDFHDFFKNWVAITHWMPLPDAPEGDQR